MSLAIPLLLNITQADYDIIKGQIRWTYLWPIFWVPVLKHAASRTLSILGLV